MAEGYDVIIIGTGAGALMSKSGDSRGCRWTG